ncbi:MAG: LysM peptidoglycan-binding domain-containing protein [Parvibaculaceae bacterium]
MKNPLALFAGAALATLAALAGLNMTDWPGGLSDSQKAAEAASQAGGTAAMPAEQKPAAEEAGKTAENPTEIAAIPALEPPKAETAAGKPELDTVRVESDGQAIVAGRAKPGAEVSLKLGDQVIGRGVVNSDGSWVVVPDQPLPKGAHEITIEQKAADAAPVAAEQSIAVAVPEKPGQQAMVALTEPGTATKVLQSGGNQEQASLTEPAPQPGPDQPKTEAAAKPAEPAQAAQEPPKADETAAAPAETPAEGTAPAGAEQPASQNTTVAKTEAEELPDPVKPAEPTPAKPQQAGTAKNVPLGLDAVDYNDKGDIIFSGRARPGTAVRLYVDNRAVGDAMVDGAGAWTFAGKGLIAPGTHDLRVDQIDKAGKVIARVELPFLRENAEAVAALNTPPEPQAAEAEPQPEADEAQPEAEPPAQETTAAAPAQPKAEQPQATAAEQPQATTAEPPQTAAAEPPQTAAAEPPQTAVAEPPSTTAEPQKTAEPAPSAPEPAKTAAAEPPQTSGVEKAEPQAASPAPAQPAAGDKKPEETTTAAAEQAAQAIEAINPRPGKIVIQPGNNLWKLSRIIYGRGKNYTVIYQANKDQIRSPGRIYPGQIFAIPGALPPETIDPKRKEPLTSAEGGATQQ